MKRSDALLLPFYILADLVKEALNPSQTKQIERIGEEKNGTYADVVALYQNLKKEKSGFSKMEQ